MHILGGRSHANSEHWSDCVNIWVFAGRTGLIIQKCFPNIHIPCSPKLISFPRCLGLLIWVYTVCIFKILLCASFVCISDEKRLYNLMNISLFFSLSGFPTTISCDVTTMSMWFLRAEQGKCYFVTFAFSGYLHIYFCNLYWKCECPRIACHGISKQTHENLHRDY